VYRLLRKREASRSLAATWLGGASRQPRREGSCRPSFGDRRPRVFASDQLAERVAAVIAGDQRRVLGIEHGGAGFRQAGERQGGRRLDRLHRLDRLLRRRLRLEPLVELGAAAVALGGRCLADAGRHPRRAFEPYVEMIVMAPPGPELAEPGAI